MNLKLEIQKYFRRIVEVGILKYHRQLMVQEEQDESLSNKKDLRAQLVTINLENLSNLSTLKQRNLIKF
jgi:hypothetical protein